MGLPEYMLCLAEVGMEQTSHDLAALKCYGSGELKLPQPLPYLGIGKDFYTMSRTQQRLLVNYTLTALARSIERWEEILSQPKVRDHKQLPDLSRNIEAIKKLKTTTATVWGV